MLYNTLNYDILFVLCWCDVRILYKCLFYETISYLPRKTSVIRCNNDSFFPFVISDDESSVRRH